MVWFNKLVISLFVIFSFSAQASINVSLHQDLQLLVVENKNVGFTLFDNNQFTLENGTHQIVVRVSKLVSKQGQKEKFKSTAIVVRFNANDANVTISPSRTFMRTEEIQGFDKNPQLIATINGQNTTIEQQLLTTSESITQDYAAQLKAQNNVNGIEHADVIASSSTAIEVNSVSSLEMTQRLFVKASEIEKTRFTDWAFKNRKSFDSALNGESKVLVMLEYWYQKSSFDEKAQILTWIITQ